MSTQQHNFPVAEDSRHIVLYFWLLSADVRKPRNVALHHKAEAPDAY